MRIVVQRVSHARVFVNDVLTGSIEAGLLVLVGVAKGDSPSDADYLAGKVTSLRIFNDESGKMNRSVADVSGQLLIVSNFTLLGDIQKGNRPSFDSAAPPDKARSLYDYFVERVKQTGIPVKTGVFQAHMQVFLENDGPVTLVCESRSA